LKFAKVIYPIVVFLTLLWCALIVLAPVLEHYNYQGYSFFIYKSFSRICHQLPERSFYILGQKFAVCERCTSIYFSFFVGVLLFPVIKRFLKSAVPSKAYIIIPAALLMLDFLFGYIGLLQNEYTIVITGSVFGFIISYYMVYGLIESLAIRRGERDSFQI
jgi:uncharacterized membrane protein